MILAIPQQLETWEAVATVSIAKAIGAKIVFHPLANPEVGMLMWLASVPLAEEVYDSTKHPSLNYLGAYRQIENSKLSYAEILAVASGLKDVALLVPTFSKISQSDDSDIVVCPFGLKLDLDLPSNCWRSIVQMLRTYSENIFLLGERGQRLDAVGFPEAHILSDLTIEEKLETLAKAKLIIGVPNAWTWAVTGWTKKLIYFYPDKQLAARWFPWPGDTFFRIWIDTNNIQIPPMLAGLRKAISLL